ncbi:alternative ribosome rescue aminoacyl-tRNA hydrolase ArfB [Aquimarina brevivitae]|uniref:Ribosome-associated protein n=1 Tax=Aquimarina brevivitae TaxID=323412 RepID=A0A4Q7PHG5_9FLAO|nr:alternative ribosome rescue aminoacyl-tRNA hydrolase ArfB [Aquimarina brevivitae]RZS99597.1 ribosome-associated protein [Aquimarina brevivitae]
MKVAELLKEVNYKFVRSSGPGGQNVNKVSSKVELYFDLKNSLALSEKEKSVLSTKLTNYISKDQLLILKCDSARSQHKNKDIVSKRLITLLKKALQKTAVRKKTKLPQKAVKKRLEQKKRNAEKKANRRDPLR